MTERVIDERELNRALLARQLLLERATLPIVDAVERVGGLQMQYAPSGYVGLWTRLAGFRRDELTAALEDRSVVQATLMRTTIHLVSRREYWRFTMGVRRARREWALRATGATEAAMAERAGELARALADGPRTVKELGRLASGFVGSFGVWLDLVRVPPSGTWPRRRADRLALAEQWVGPCDATEEEGEVHLVRSYLGAFGPAAWSDIASWAGLPVAALKRAGAKLDLVEHRDAAGRPLVDLADAPPTDVEATVPVRFLPHWDANLLVHARRTALLPEEYRPRVFSTRNPFSVGVCLVDGRVVGSWSWRDDSIVLQLFEDIPKARRRAVEHERSALEAFYR
jgi:hypothetical protein